jgi:hypothetical protein
MKKVEEPRVSALRMNPACSDNAMYVTDIA